ETSVGDRLYRGGCFGGGGQSLRSVLHLSSCRRLAQSAATSNARCASRCVANISVKRSMVVLTSARCRTATLETTSGKRSASTTYSSERGRSSARRHPV